MKNRASRKSGLFLLEFMLALLFFAFSAAVCVHVFVQAKTLNTQSHALNQSVLLTQNAAECFQATGGDINLLNVYLKGSVNDNQLTLTYDKNWIKTEPNNAFYVLTITRTEATASFASATVVMSEGGAVIYQLTVHSSPVSHREVHP